MLFSHPKDFTPVCTTELGYMAKLKPEFDKRNTKVIGLSVDPGGQPQEVGERHQGDAGHAPNYPMIGDPDLSVSKLYGMLPAEAGTSEGRTPMDNQTVRNGLRDRSGQEDQADDQPIPMTTGRNFDEVLRVLDSLQLTAKHKVATPVNWKQGEDVIIAGSVSDDEAKKIYPHGWKSPRPYIRIVPQPERRTSQVTSHKSERKTEGRAGLATVGPSSLWAEAGPAGGLVGGRARSCQSTTTRTSSSSVTFTSDSSESAPQMLRDGGELAFEILFGITRQQRKRDALAAPAGPGSLASVAGEPANEPPK